ncbi:MAG: S8 family serine peptidase [bacterium]
MRVLIFLLFPSLIFADFVKDEILVKFREKKGLQTMGIEVQSIEPLFDNTYRLKLKKGIKVFDTIDKLKQNPDVVYAEPNYIRKAYITPNDPKFNDQWSFPKISAPAAWDIEKGTSSVVIAILDTGIDYTHPDLNDKIIGSQSFVPYEKDPMDYHSHGSHVSGIAAGETNNGIGIAGLAWNCKILAIKCLDKYGYGNDADISLAIRYSADNGAKVINMSLGAPQVGNFLKDACDYAYNKNVFIVAAAGNDGTEEKNYPAAYDNVMAVAATDSNDNKAWFSQYGSWVDISAPGVYILSTIPEEKGTYAYMSGTSMASPFVAGLAGLLFSRYPGATNAFVFSEIRNRSDNIKREDFGRINVLYSLWGENRPPSAFSITQPENNGWTSSQYPTFRWSTSFDPDWKDEIRYSVFLRKGEEGLKNVANTSDTFWTPNFKKPLAMDTTYSWQVIASDSQGGTASSSISTFTTTSIKVFPNPAKFGQIVRFRGSPLTFKDTFILIYTISGELVLKLPAGRGEEISWDTKNIASGVYLYTISNSDKTFGLGKIGVIK